MLEPSGSELNSAYGNLADAFSGSLSWEWDSRFGGILAAFEIKDKDRVSGIVSARFAQVWDKASIKGAPKGIKGAMRKFGGLQPGQLLFTSDLTQDVILFGLWWPWGNGSTISVRFVPYLPDSPRIEEDARVALKGAFGL